jgi:hypothetical protein
MNLTVRAVIREKSVHGFVIRRNVLGFVRRYEFGRLRESCEVVRSGVGAHGLLVFGIVYHKLGDLDRSCQFRKSPWGVIPVLRSPQLS